MKQISTSSVGVALKSNNFDLLRLIFAVMVFFVHISVLSADSHLVFLRSLSSEFAVKSFFVVSGFLIVMSYDRSSSIGGYISKRWRRIFPAYFVSVVGFACLGFLFSHLDALAYFSVDWVKYVFSNLFFLNFLNPTLPGLFESNPINVVNGALWTLEIEVLFYLSLPLIVFGIRKLGCWQVLLALYLTTFLYRYGIEFLYLKDHPNFYEKLRHQFPGELAYFIAGSALFYYFDIFKRYWQILLLLAISFLFFDNNSILSGFIEPLVMALIVIYFALIFRSLGNFAKYGDFSYGIYILHFPIVQIFVSYHLFDQHPFSALLTCVGVVSFLAILMWYFVEKPFLSKSSHYVAVKIG